MRICKFCMALMLICSVAGCAGNIRNVSTEAGAIGAKESLLAGRIETIPAFWEFSLYDEETGTEDEIDIGGKGFGITRAQKLQNEGYIFKIVRPGLYVLRLRKLAGQGETYDEILRFKVSEGRLFYFGTIKIAIDNVQPSAPLRGRKGEVRQHLAFRYHYQYIPEDETLRFFENLYPDVYAAFKDRMIRIPSLSIQAGRILPAY